MKKFITKYNKELLVTAAVLIYAGLFIFFYPSMYAIQDEADYFDFAYRLKSGTMYFDLLTSHKVVFNGKNYVDMYPPGMSILLLPFTFIHWKATLSVNFLLHILGLIFFIKSLKLLKIDIRYSLLYLFFPSFILYSRTIMPDPAIGSLVSVAVYFYLKGRRLDKFFSGLIFGFLTLIKNVSIIIPLAYLSVLIIREYFIKRQKKISEVKTLSFLIGLLPFTFLAVIYNLVAFGDIITTPIAAGGVLSVKFLPAHFVFYFTFLILFYPVMFFAPLLYRQKNKLEFIGSTSVFIVFISMWSFIQPAEGFLKQMMVGSRYVIAILPIYLLTYAEVMNRVFTNIKNSIKTFIFILVIPGLVFSTYLINVHHQGYLNQQLYYRDTLYANTHEDAFIVCNSEAKELLQRIWGSRKWISFTDPNLIKYLDSMKKFYIVAFLRKDKPQEFMTDKKRKNALVKKYGAELVKEVKAPYKLQIYKVGL